MILRLDDEDTDALRARSAVEGRSMQAVAQQAVREYIENYRRAELLDKALDGVLPQCAEAL